MSAEAIDRRYLTKGIYQVLSDVKVSEPVEMKLVHYLSLTLLLLVTSPTLLASVPVSIDTDGDGIEDSQDADDDS